jgi:hypothetical protein
MITTETVAEERGGAPFELPPLFRVQNSDQNPYERAPIRVSFLTIDKW